MTLPDLALQIIYGHVAWALVLAAVLLACFPGLARRHPNAVAAGTVVLAVLPGAWSPAWWLTLAFQYPSGLLAALCLVALRRRRHDRAPRFVLPLALALPLTLGGVVLYLDTFGVLALGLYHGGFGAVGMPLLGCAAIAACAFAIWRGHVYPALPLLAGLLLYALLRLPTGNLWDALLDPLLWAWSLASSLAWAVRLATAGAPAPQPVPVQAPVLAPALAQALAAEPAPLGAADIEQLQTVRE